jgi:hypothetical protein
MTASDAMRSLGSTVLSLVNTFVQMGVEWVKSAIMGRRHKRLPSGYNGQCRLPRGVQTRQLGAAAAATRSMDPAAIMSSMPQWVRLRHRSRRVAGLAWRR